MNRNEAIEKAAQAIAETKAIQIYDTALCPVDPKQMKKLKKALAMPKDAALIAELRGLPKNSNLYPPFPDDAPQCDELVRRSLIEAILAKYEGKS